VSIERIRIESEKELEEMITQEMGQIENDLTVICDHVPINEKTTLDVLCHDGNGQLVIIQLNVNEDDYMLIKGLQSLDYLDKFKSFLKATYNKHKINDKEKPRLVLIAPSFSDTLRHAVESMKGMEIDLYEWEYLKLGDHKGLHLQPIFTAKPREERLSKPAKKKETVPEKIEEPETSEPPQEFPNYTKSPSEEPKEEPTFKPEKEEPQQKKKLKLF
jgi:hypothetical protein